MMPPLQPFTPRFGASTFIETTNMSKEQRAEIEKFVHKKRFLTHVENHYYTHSVDKLELTQNVLNKLEDGPARKIAEEMHEGLKTAEEYSEGLPQDWRKEEHRFWIVRSRSNKKGADFGQYTRFDKKLLKKLEKVGLPADQMNTSLSGFDNMMRRQFSYDKAAEYCDTLYDPKYLRGVDDNKLYRITLAAAARLLS